MERYYHCRKCGRAILISSIDADQPYRCECGEVYI